jgi:hypothetical protein
MRCSSLCRKSRICGSERNGQLGSTHIKLNALHVRLPAGALSAPLPHCPTPVWGSVVGAVLLRDPLVQVLPLEIGEFSGKEPAIAFNILPMATAQLEQLEKSEAEQQADVVVAAEAMCSGTNFRYGCLSATSMLITGDTRPPALAGP